MNMVAAVQPTGVETLSLQVRETRREAIDINSYEHVDLEGTELPADTADSHVDIHLGNGLSRQYSLCNDPADRGRYVIAVLREDAGHGGSRHLHESLRVHDRVEVGRPRNNFYLNPATTGHMLVAGGIRITPVAATAHWPSGTVRRERFAPTTSTFVEPAETAGALTLEIATTGAHINVPEDCSIADALNASAIPVPTPVCLGSAAPASFPSYAVRLTIRTTSSRRRSAQSISRAAFPLRVVGCWSSTCE